MGKPKLSIGIIFKNDIRCIERCLKALQPLRDAIPCELVMADTGSGDGSREIAEKYADILFDFPWINDFAAARNAVIERCSGEWYLSVDTDEYLDGDFEELTQTLLSDDGSANLYRVNIRNHDTYEMDGTYGDFYALRIFRMSLGCRYKGVIHERLSGGNNTKPLQTLPKVIFHHDGYVKMGSEAGRAKRARNLSLIKKALEKEPENLLLRLQAVESSFGEDDLVTQLRRALALVKKKAPEWRLYGPPILRHAVSIAYEKKLKEFRHWQKWAEEWFPDSYFTRIDVGVYSLLQAWREKEYDESARRGEALRVAYADLRAGRGDTDCQSISPLKAATPYYETLISMLLASSYQERGRAEEAASLLEGVDPTCLDQEQTKNLVKTVCVLHGESRVDTAPLISAVWEGATSPVPNQAKASLRRAAFLAVGSQAFSRTYREEEIGREDRYCRPTYTVFLPLRDRCSLGTAAAVLESEHPGEMRELLANVENWNELPYPAVSHAILAGVVFPLPGRPMDIEDMDALAARMSKDWDKFYEILRRAAGEAFTGSWQTLAWVRALALAAVKRCKWESAEQGMELARIFVRVERTFITGCYAPELLREGNLFILPAMHRFGWYCVQAFESLDAGDTVGYVSQLRQALSVYDGMKAMVEFLTEHTPAVQAPPPNAELLALAEKVRTILSAYPPDDPAVAALKNSPVYQRVAYLIEE